MHLTYLGLGANLENPDIQVKNALEELKKKSAFQNFKVSRLFDTTPVSTIVQKNFINAVCSFETELSIYEIFEITQAIERKLGKTIKEKDHPRLIDIDILLSGPSISSCPSLIVPHPGLLSRLFVLIPLQDITSKILIPHQKKGEIEMQTIYLEEYIKNLNNIYNEKVVPIT